MTSQVNGKTKRKVIIDTPDIMPRCKCGRYHRCTCGDCE